MEALPLLAPLGLIAVAALVLTRPAPQFTGQQHAHVMLYLRRLASAGGFIADGLDDPDPEVSRLAERLGYIDTGSGWSAGVSLTDKGSRALATFAF